MEIVTWARGVYKQIHRGGHHLVRPNGWVKISLPLEFKRLLSGEFSHGWYPLTGHSSRNEPASIGCSIIINKELGCQSVSNHVQSHLCLRQLGVITYIDDLVDWFLLDQESGFMCPSTNKKCFYKIVYCLGLFILV